jgi:hypothetical protein
MPEPGIYPRETPRPTDSHAERRVYEALKAGLPDGWYAWHSLRVRTREGWLGEGDLVLAEPRTGLLVLEVKGGRVVVHDGRWRQNGQAMDPDPMKQALRFRGLLLDRLRDAGCHPPSHSLGHRVKVAAEHRVRLEQEQLDLLDQLDGNARMLVEGPAGSGKTLLAREAAARFAAGGTRVLLLTFT